MSESIFKNTRVKIGIVIAAIITVILILWFFIFRKSEVKPPVGPGVADNDGPQLEVSGIKTVKPVNTSGYAIKTRYEYALGDFIGDNIDFTINLTTKGGFEESGIIALLIERYKSDGTTLLDSFTVKNIKNYKEYQVKFLGSELTTDAVSESGGTNTFKVFGVTDAGTDTTPATLFDAHSKQAGIQELGKSTQNLDVSDLNYTKNSLKNTPFTFDMSTGTTGMDFGTDIKRSLFNISIDPWQRYSILPDTNNSGQYIFRNNNTNSNLTVGTVNSFKIDKIGDKFRLYIGDEFVTKREGHLIMKKPHLMSPEEANTSLITITEMPLWSGGKFILAKDGFMWHTHSDDYKNFRFDPYVNDKKHAWEIIPSGKHDDKYWLVRGGLMWYAREDNVWRWNPFERNQGATMLITQSEDLTSNKYWIVNSSISDYKVWYSAPLNDRNQPNWVTKSWPGSTDTASLMEFIPV